MGCGETVAFAVYGPAGFCGLTGEQTFISEPTMGHLSSIASVYVEGEQSKGK